ncbi:hypothetical protein B296_00051767 [Ensete ventricosum]|uniref:Uncharacterized protein n=1 Tax=Ensete ventricosum TaxID=4639 RepID=A0A426X6L9_ENSVE|nr:hypothetical protein B296_00051767 [Ensete ventricosum]
MQQSRCVLARSTCSSTECVHKQQCRPRCRWPRPCVGSVAWATASSGGCSRVCHKRLAAAACSRGRVTWPQHTVVVMHKRRPQAGLPQVAAVAQPDVASVDAGKRGQVMRPRRPQPCVGSYVGHNSVLAVA